MARVNHRRSLGVLSSMSDLDLMPRTRRMSRHGVIALTVAVVTVGAFLLGALLGTSTGSTDEGTTVRGEPTRATVQPANVEPAPGVEREPEPQPQRVLLIGDSIMENTGDHLLSELRRIYGDDLIVRVEGHPGSGLLTSEKYDWPNHFGEILNEFDPDIVVALFAGNYPSEWPYVTGPDGQPMLPDSPEFHQAWQDASAQVSNRALQSGSSMWWITPPPMREAATWGRRSDNLGQIYRGLAADMAGVEVIESAPVVGGPNGEFVLELPDPDTGVMRQARSVDGLHLTSFGGRLLARAVAYHLSVRG